MADTFNEIVISNQRVARELERAGQAVGKEERSKVPMLEVFRHHPGAVVMGTLSSLATFVLFYLMTVFALSWGTTALGYSRETFLIIQLVGIVFFANCPPKRYEGLCLFSSKKEW